MGLFYTFFHTPKVVCGIYHSLVLKKELSMYSKFGFTENIIILSSRENPLAHPPFARPNTVCYCSKTI